MYSDFDLQVLNGQAIIIPLAHQRNHERTEFGEDDLIKSLHAYHNKQIVFEKDPSNLEERLQMLFLIKDKWTSKELFYQL